MQHHTCFTYSEASTIVSNSKDNEPHVFVITYPNSNDLTMIFGVLKRGIKYMFTQPDVIPHAKPKEILDRALAHEIGIDYFSKTT